MSLSLRAGICMVILFAMWILCIANFVLESFFTEPVEQLTRIVNKDEILIEFPLAFRRAWKTDIIYPPGSVDVSGGRVYLKPGKYIVSYEGKYYWVSEDFVIVDYAHLSEILSYPIMGGIQFILTDGVYVASERDIDIFAGAVEGILADRRVLALVSYFDFKNNVLLLRRGIRVKVLDWESLNTNKELLLQLENASDRSEYIFLSDGKLLRAR
ncbi:DUF4894 domain-containing protein [Mesotoga prima]|uniref:DUF4894 domain-containing protein n=4 Tax=Kosmotogaceae TaxID=1643948 RepID=UPI001BD50F02|nr:DUF4894 domain-containing protein [Mesotoga prima]MCB1222971.1 DUF4894 domain-containing protein [Mesotoga sp.]MCP5460740.1 DUF4894 domain-containing protein [Thermotogota bacterium]HNQ70939.1 DUF4894 domain-containing protein [Mesotoga prima]HNS76032.1 DUF4894 domain-containing protein [Mesotoga prima]HPE53629.1 DUF4894 domain-containing protein [Mesotoga prima]